MPFIGILTCTITFSLEYPTILSSLFHLFLLDLLRLDVKNDLLNYDNNFINFHIDKL